MSRHALFLAAAVVLIIVVGAVACSRPPQGAPPSSPAFGYTLHIDAIKHINTAPELVVHHYCKSITDQVSQCLLFDKDGPNARLIGVETIISPQMYAALPEAEKPNWHYHKTEIPQVDAKLPGLSEKEAAAVVAKLEDTYGKVVIFWEPKDPAPIGFSITRPYQTPGVR
ncbi:MAG: DUF1264 domain-containing protein [Chloroflexi bacterium]|nr:DUF1264 domain-containing protein [Chloroflexota bacterium]